MEEMYRQHEPEGQDAARQDQVLNEPPLDQAAETQPSVNGAVHISEEVIVELAKKNLASIAGVQPASQSIASKFGIGRKSGDGVRVAVEEKGSPSVSVDVYLLVKFGLRIPDVAWDVQESIKKTLESYTGYAVKAVNVNIQGVYFEDVHGTAPQDAPSADKPEDEEKIILPDVDQL